LDLFSGIETLNDDSDWNIYPNPTSGIFKIESKNVLEFIRVYNSNGSLVYSIEIANGSKMLEIDISSMTTGIYYLTSKQNDRWIGEKIIIN